MPQKIQWIVDGYGIESLHTNEPSKSFKDSFLGQIARDGDKWFFVTAAGDKIGPFKSWGAAKQGAIQHVGGEYV